MAEATFWRSPVDPERVMQAPVTHWHEHEAQRREEQLAVEEPLEVRVNQQRLAVIMRTPSHDFELAAGFLFTEGLIPHADSTLVCEYVLDEDNLPQPNVVNVQIPQIHPPAPDPESQTCAAPLFERRFTVSSSCGLCGKNSIADVLQLAAPLIIQRACLSASTFYTLANRLREQQAVFSHTGGLHAAALFSFAGELQLLREDIGRHNAVDKLIGHGLLHHLPPYEENILLVSGRTSFEILQKALLARIPCVAAISAPSSLAVEFAARAGITLVGFLRGRSMNVYTWPERISQPIL